MSFIVLVLTLNVFAAAQGQAVQMAFPHQPGAQSAHVQWQDKTVPLVRVDDRWVTVFGVDLDAKPGEHSADAVFTMEDGRIEKQPVVVRIEKADFPTTQLKVADRYVQLSPANQKRAARESAEIDRIYSSVTNEILWTKRFSVPIPNETGSNFGHRRVFNGESRAPHSGADLRAATGTPIRSTNRGRVVLAKHLFFTGYTVIVDHGLGIYSLYAHLSKVQPKPGEIVENGEVIGLSGATGRVTGPHLHWGIRIQGARVDPFSLVNLTFWEGISSGILP